MDLLNCSVPAVSRLLGVSWGLRGLVRGGFRTSLTCIASPKGSEVSKGNGQWYDWTYIDLDLLPVRILDGGIIALYPHILDKLRYIGCQILVYGAGIQVSCRQSTSKATLAHAPLCRVSFSCSPGSSVSGWSYLRPERRYDSPSCCYICVRNSTSPQRRGVKPLVPVGHDQGVVRLSQLALYLCLLPPVIAFSKVLVVAPQPYLSAPLYLCEYGIRSGWVPAAVSPSWQRI